MLVGVEGNQVREPHVINSSLAVSDTLPNIRSVCVGKFLLLLCQLILAATIVYLFNIEARRHFFPVFCVMIAGFAVHSWLPNRYRLLFFAALCMGSVLFLLGIETGAWVLGLGGVLIAICYLPISATIRTIMLIVAATILASIRASTHQPFWPVLGSMFMFRLVTFVHELRRSKVTPPLSSTLAYFFLLPNTCFPLFPVIDYKTFCETRYNEDEWEIYQRGVAWIIRGLIHLLLYRYIRAYIVPEPYQLYDITYIAIFVVTNYSLYLQVSGQFHLITGLLHLFGFNLPRTHLNFFLASSFSDIWRRINIYWKDFMTKYFFYPAFFALRYRGASLSVAMVGSVFYVFLSTWLLHSWQTFWLLGRFPLTVNDACLWLGAGSFVAINVVLEARRRVHQDPSPLFSALRLSAQTVAMFILVAIFWACWTKQGFLQLVFAALGRSGSTAGVLWILGSIAAAIFVGTGFALLSNKTSPNSASTTFDFYASAKLQLAALTVALAFTAPRADIMYPTHIAKAISMFRADPTIAADAGSRLESYYEELNSTKIQAGPLINGLLPTEAKAEPDGFGFFKVSRNADLYQVTELIPGIETDLGGAKFSVNEYGMRDRKSIPFAKPSGTIRIALIGSSVVMGYGVSDEEVFARRFELRLNEQYGTSLHKFEVLNFGVGRQWPEHRLVRIQRKVMAFQPDALYYIAHQDEFKGIGTSLAQLIANRLDLPSKHLQEVAGQAGVDSRLAPGAIMGRMSVFQTELLSAIYKSIVDECQQHAALPVWIYLPIPSRDPSEEQATRTRLFPLAKDAGFLTGDLSDWMHGQTQGLFADDEFHPTARGHELITEALMEMIRTSPELLPMK